ncbi:hypothetical protein T484DRAFT_1841747 [Baffinella frigidus]|nr:hypothetical protein T484DRAFT_1841747 [Cryptophyta sp. CCMP2293]
MRGLRKGAVVGHMLRHRNNAKKSYNAEHNDPLRDFYDENEENRAAARLEKLETILAEKAATGKFTIDGVERKAVLRERQVDGMLHMVEDRLYRTGRYHACFGLTSFIVFFAIVLVLQRDVPETFSIASAIFTTLVGDLPMETMALTSKDDFTTWFGDKLVNQVFTDSYCGNGVCEDPDEYPGFGRFGCIPDCGYYLKRTTITIDLAPYAMSTKGDGTLDPTGEKDWDLSDIRMLVQPDFRYNLWSETMSAFIFEEDMEAKKQHPLSLRGSAVPLDPVLTLPLEAGAELVRVSGATSWCG